MIRLMFHKGPSSWCAEGPFHSPLTDAGGEQRRGDKGAGSPHQVHDDENTFPGCCSGLSPTLGCCQGQLGTGTSKTGSDGNLFNSLRLQAWVTIITQHAVVTSRREMGLNHNSNESQVPG